MLTRPDKVKLHTLLGNYPNVMAMKDGRVKSDLIEWDFPDFPVPNRGFKPMVREHKFDCGELAIVTFLQAREFGLPYVLLPATVVGRGQLHTVAYNSERGTMKASDLNGKKFGVRIDIQPSGSPGLVVSLRNIDPDPALSVGSTVAAARTKMGSVLDLSSVETSALAGYTRDRGQHVHLEVRPAVNLSVP